jgi:hypothetical protein
LISYLKEKAVPLHATRKNSSYSFTTSALDGGEWFALRPDRTLAAGKGPPVPIVQEAGWAPEPVWTQRLEGKVLSPLPGIEPRSPGRPARGETLTELPQLTYLLNILFNIIPLSKLRYFKWSQRFSAEIVYAFISILINPVIIGRSLYWLVDETVQHSISIHYCR